MTLFWLQNLNTHLTKAFIKRRELFLFLTLNLQEHQNGSAKVDLKDHKRDETL